MRQNFHMNQVHIKYFSYAFIMHSICFQYFMICCAFYKFQNNGKKSRLKVWITLLNSIFSEEWYLKVVSHANLRLFTSRKIFSFFLSPKKCFLMSKGHATMAYHNHLDFLFFNQKCERYCFLMTSMFFQGFMEVAVVNQSEIP